jgi:NAD(P)-dependent dehydrogenase (short-subunit alcohol dehydrogenase family)
VTKRTQKVVVVTGASTGLGASLARELARQGFHVLAGVRRDRDADAIRSTGIEPVLLDITKAEQVEALAAGRRRPARAARARQQRRHPGERPG